jgi:hypothetical protein
MSTTYVIAASREDPPILKLLKSRAFNDTCRQCIVCKRTDEWLLFAMQLT